jgi:hypothetical protein
MQKKSQKAASLATVFQTIDAARTLAYDAARHGLYFAKVEKELRRL